MWFSNITAIFSNIQIQHLLKLNNLWDLLKLLFQAYSNTTLVKVKLTNAGISALGNKIFKYNTC